MHDGPVGPGGPPEQRRGEGLLHGALEATGAVGPGEGLGEQPLAHPRPHLQLVAGGAGHPRQVGQDGVEDRGHAGAVEASHEDEGVEAVEYLGRQEAPNLRLGVVAAVVPVAESGRRAREGLGPGVGREDHVQSGGVHRPARVVGERAIAEELEQEGVAQDGRGLVHLVEQEDGVRARLDAGGEPAAAAGRADVAGGRAEQGRAEMVGGERSHVHPDERLGAPADLLGERARQQRLAGPGAPGQQQGGTGPVAHQAQPRGAQCHLGGHGAARLLLAQDRGGQGREELLDVGGGGLGPGVVFLRGQDARASQDRPPARPQVQQPLPEAGLVLLALRRVGQCRGGDRRFGDGDLVVLLQSSGGRAQVVHDLRGTGAGAGVHGCGSRQQEGGAAQVLQLLPAPGGEDDERRDAQVAGRRARRAGQARLDGVVVHDDQDVAPVIRGEAVFRAGAQVRQAPAPVQDAGPVRGAVGGAVGGRGGVLQGVVESVDQVVGREVIGGDEDGVLRIAGDEAGEHLQGPAVEIGMSRLVLGRQRRARARRGGRGGLSHGLLGAGVLHEVRRRGEAGRLGAARRHGERGADTGIGVDIIEVQSIAHAVYDGHDVSVSVMHDEGRAPRGPPRRVSPGRGRFESSRGCARPCDAIPWSADWRASARGLVWSARRAPSEAAGRGCTSTSPDSWADGRNG